MLWRALSEEQPGPRWAGLFAEYWPAYRKWWLRDGESARPTYLECHRALASNMPELVPLYDSLCELAGGGDMAARFLSQTLVMSRNTSGFQPICSVWCGSNR